MKELWEGVKGLCKDAENGLDQGSWKSSYLVFTEGARGWKEGLRGGRMRCRGADYLAAPSAFGTCALTYTVTSRRQ